MFKTEKISAALILLLTIAILVFLETYNRMDKFRFRAQIMLKKMRDNILAWVKAAEGLMERFQDRPEHPEFKDLAGQVQAAGGRQWPEIVPKLNRIHTLVQAVVEEHGADAQVAASARELNEISDRLSELRADYNKCAKSLNTQLGRSIGGGIGRFLRIRPMAPLADLVLTLPPDAPAPTLPLRFRTPPAAENSAAPAEAQASSGAK